MYAVTDDVIKYAVTNNSILNAVTNVVVVVRPGNNSCLFGSLNQLFYNFCESVGFWTTSETHLEMRKF